MVAIVTTGAVASAALLLSFSLVVRRGLFPPIINRVYLESEYDFIVVGAGSAGSVIASRLSEVPEWSVLLLEAGVDETGFSLVPGLADLLRHTEGDWNYKTESSNDYCLGTHDRSCTWPAGKALGGTSTIDNMLYERGNKDDYNNWVTMGAEGWGFDDVLQYFNKAADNTNKQYLNSPYNAGHGGPLTVQSITVDKDLNRRFLNSASFMGYNVTDANGDIQTGFMAPQFTVRDGSRCSSARAYLRLREVFERRNLHVAKKAFVTKILLDGLTLRAEGIEFQRGRERRIVKVRKEVIISAGAIRSPQLLMLSGIGPPSELRRNGIQTFSSLQGVGANLQDHVTTGKITFTYDKPTANNANSVYGNKKEMKDSFQTDLLKWLGSEKGSFKLPVGIEGTAFLNSNLSGNSPDIQLILQSESVINEDKSVNSKSYYSGYNKRYFYDYSKRKLVSTTKQRAEKGKFSITAVVLSPKSRGSITLQTRNPLYPPAIDPNYFNDPADLELLLEGIRLTFDLIQTPLFKELNPVYYSKGRDDHCKHLKVLSRKYWECYVRHYTSSAYHYAGTCRMGSPSDPNSVVDPRLRVLGDVKGLRVADASVMPQLPTGGTNAPTIMIGEKAAQMIKEDWEAQRRLDVYRRRSFRYSWYSF